MQAVEASVTKAETDEQENKPAREAAITTVEPASQIAENRNQEALMAAFVREVEAEHPQFTIISAVLRKVCVWKREPLTHCC